MLVIASTISRELPPHDTKPPKFDKERIQHPMKYKNLIIEDAHPPAQASEINLLEEMLKKQLPNDYKSFLRSCNGGYLDYDILLEVGKTSAEYLSFSTLYPLSCEDEWESNPFELNQAKQQADFPNVGVLPIGGDGGSSVLYLDLRNGGQVVASVSGLPQWTGLRQESSLVLVANSFNEYLNKLTILDETIKHHIENFLVSEETVASTLEWFDSIGPQWRGKFGALWNEYVPFKQV
ncbi:hypothetical protein FX988_01170 [Paraglaciecola mesophila]|uniref:Knr4/Smi1-like domain-containing protein n=1 Tax=Paraglaciecola mesophila TaxID=197222 RepID=A0A857JI77_9ALTE|nr:SMI1/KNR4 family protein [Paraglaciecola mesophila]QHJ10948.1 hypothetical protein FX988_01170 [Paraglaciecola mesophila]